MRQLDSEAKKTSANILKSLYESAASVKKQINTDKPDEAPKEEKEALIKKVQKPEVPHKEHIVESADESMVSLTLTDSIEAADLYRKLEPKYNLNIEVFEKDELGNSDYVINGKKSDIINMLNEVDPNIVYELEDSDFKPVNEMNESADPFKDEKIRQLQDKVAELQAYLTDTPEVPEDEKTSIQSQIDEMLDEINYLENELEESSLTERINKDNIGINRAIANPNLGKNKDRIKQAGYKIDYDGETIINPKTGKSVWLPDYDRDSKKKVDFKGKLDSTREPKSTTYAKPTYAGKGKQIPSNAVYKKDYAGDAIIDFDSAQSYQSYFNKDPKSISKNINYYKKAIQDRDKAKSSAEFNREHLGYYEDKVKNAQKDLNKQKDFIDKREKEADLAEQKRKEIINKARARRNESALTEARNPENDEANELIRTALNDPEYAKNHTSELRKHGIKYIKPEKRYDNGALEGKQGRRLNIVGDPDWRKDDVRDVTNYGGYDTDNAYAKGYKSDDARADEIDLHQKNYKNSKSDYALAKNNIKRQRTKVANMKKKDAGKWNSKTFDAEQKLRSYENTLKRGITAGFAPSDKIHPDTDLKGFLNAKKHSDRPLAREKDPKYRRDRGVIVDPANKDVEDYKWAKSERKYLDRERERINQSNQEDQDRIEEMKKRAAEEKARREKGYKAQEKDWKNVDTRLNKKLDKYRQRMSK